MGPSGAKIARRRMIALATILGLSGCVGSSFNDQVAKDPYISLIKQEPMFTWAPPGNLHREVSYIPLRPPPLASQDSVVGVVYFVPDPATIPSLIQLARDASLANGFSEAGIKDANGTSIRLIIQSAQITQGLSLIFRAPAK